MRHKVEAILLIAAILGIMALVEWVILSKYEPPKSDMPGVLHLR